MKQYQNKKFAMILGCGYDGAGITRALIEMMNWCKERGIVVKVFEYKFPGVRYVAQPLEYTTFDKNNYKDIVKELNDNFDVVMFHAYPTKDYDAESMNAFYDFAHSIKIIKVGTDHSSTKNVLNRMPQIMAIVNEMDLVYAFGPYGCFGTAVKKFFPHKPLKRFNLWFNFNSPEYKRYISFNERQRRIVYFGRFAMSKNAHKVPNIGKKILDIDNTLKTEMFGISAGISAKVNVFDNPYVIRKGKKDTGGPKACIDVYGPYERSKMMDYVANSLFGISLFYSGRHDSNKMEYAQIEMIANGVVPIFDKEWGENFETRFGTKYIDNPNSAIYIDKDNVTKEDIEKIIEVSNNREAWVNYSYSALVHAAKEFDVNDVLDQMFTEMSETVEDSKKYNSVEQMLYGITKSNELVDEYRKHKDEIVILNPSQLEKNNLSVLINKKQNLINHYKGGE